MEVADHSVSYARLAYIVGDLLYNSWNGDNDDCYQCLTLTTPDATLTTPDAAIAFLKNVLQQAMPERSLQTQHAQLRRLMAVPGGPEALCAIACCPYRDRLFVPIARLFAASNDELLLSSERRFVTFFFQFVRDERPEVASVELSTRFFAQMYAVSPLVYTAMEEQFGCAIKLHDTDGGKKCVDLFYA